MFGSSCIAGRKTEYIIEVERSCSALYFQGVLPYHAHMSMGAGDFEEGEMVMQ